MSLTETILDTLTGEIFSILVDKLKEPISNSSFVINLKEKIKGSTDENYHPDLKKWINTVLIRSFNKMSMTESQQKDIASCQEFKTTVLYFILNSDRDIRREASEINYGGWNFSEVGYVGDLLPTVADEIKATIQEFLTPGEQKISEQLSRIPSETALLVVSSLNAESYQFRLEEIKVLVKKGKVKTALIHALELNKSYLLDKAPDPFRLSILEQILHCYGRLIPSKDLDEHKMVILDMLKHVDSSDADRRERIKAINNNLYNNNEIALKHINDALSINPNNPNSIILKCRLEYVINGKESAKSILENVSSSIIVQNLPGFASTYYQIGEFDKTENCALMYLESNPTDIQCLILVAQVQDRKIQEKLQASNSFKTLNSSEISELKQLLDNVKKYIDPEDELYFLQYLDMQGRFWIWKQDFYQAANCYRIAHEMDTSNQAFLLYLIQALFATNELNEVKRLINELDFADDNTIILRCKILLECGEVDRVLSDIQVVILNTSLPKNEILKLREIQIYALRKLLKIKEAKEIEDIVNKEFAEIPYACLIRANSLLQLNLLDDAIECLQAALPEDITHNDYSEIARSLLRLLSQSDNQANLAEAIRIAETLFTPIHKDELTIIYLKLLFNRKEFGKCIQICEEIETVRGFDNEVKDIQATSLYFLKEYSASESICRDLFKKNSNQVKFIELLCYNLFKLRKFQEIRDILETAESKLSKNIQFLKLCSNVFNGIHLTDNSEDSINLAFKYAKKATEESNYLQDTVDYYLQLLFSSPEKSKPLINIEYSNHGRNLIDDYEKNYPDSMKFQKIIVPDNPDEFRQVMIDLLSKDNDINRNVIELYKQVKLPISYLATMFKKDIYDIWQNLTMNSPNLKIWLCNGIAEEAFQEDDTIIGKVDILISLHSMLLLNKLGILDLNLFEVFNTISVTQSGLNELQNLRDMMVKKAFDGSIVAVAYGGEIRVNETDSTVHQCDLQFIDEIISFTRKYCSVVGQFTIGYNKNDDLKIDEVIGDESAELITSSNIRYVVYSDDWFIRNAAANITRKKSTYILPYLRKLRKLGIISDKKYHGLILDLIKSNCYLIPIEQQTLRSIIFESSFILSDDVIICLKSMYDVNLDTEKLIHFLLALLGWIWLESVVNESKVALSLYIIDIIAKRTDQVTAFRIIQDKIDDIISPLNPLAQNGLLSLVSTKKIMSPHIFNNRI